MVDFGDLVGGGSLPAFDLGLFGLDPLLLSLHHLLGDTLVVVEVDELLLLAGEFPQPAGVAAGFLAGGLGHCLGARKQRLSNSGLLGWVKQVAPVFLLDPLLNRRDSEIRGDAAPLLAHAGQTREVLIDTAVAAVAPVAQAALTDLAVQRADEVVAVLVRAITAGPVGAEHLLDLLEDLGVDDRVMSTLALDAVEGHDPRVVVV